jgi:hypothetical protein
MTISAQSVARRVVATLNDDASVRWTLSEVVRAINDAQMQVLIDRPDLLSKTATINLVSGTRQSIPADGAKLLAVNKNANGTVPRVCNRDQLDVQVPDWHVRPASPTVRHFMFDPREAEVFYVYPPATPAAQLEIAYAAYPTHIAEPPVGAALPADPLLDANPTVVVGNLSIPDYFALAVSDFALCRLFTKDIEAGGAMRVSAHYQSYAMVLGIDIKSTLMEGPNSNSPFNPLRPAISAPQ